MLRSGFSSNSYGPTDLAPPFWASTIFLPLGPDGIAIYEAPPIIVTPGKGLFARIWSYLTAPFTALQRRLLYEYEILRLLGPRGLRLYRQLTAPNFALAGQIAFSSIDIVMLGFPSALRTVANWRGSSGYERASAVATLAAVPLGGLANSLKTIKYINNPWNYYQSITKGTGLVKSVAAYEWWKAGGLTTKGLSFQSYQRITDAIYFYNQSIPALQTSAEVLNYASFANTVGLNVVNMARAASKY